MNKSIKIILAGLILFITLYYFISDYYGESSKNRQAKNIKIIHGKTMGTSYKLMLIGAQFDANKINKLVKSRLDDIEQSMSTYIKSSDISKFNNTANTKPFLLNEDFEYVVKKALQIGQDTNGAFDITLDPLVDLWGFDRNPNKTKPAQKEITNALSKKGIKYLQLKKSHISKLKSDVTINLSGIAKGFAVDEIAKILVENKIENYLVEIGGEIKVSQKNVDNKTWKIGIRNPIINDGKEYIDVAMMSNQAIATSGLYLNYFEQDNNYYSHIISPVTGYPIQTDLISVTVIADDCIIADAMATAAIILGEVKMNEILKKYPKTTAYYIYKSATGEISTSIHKGFPLAKAK